MDTVERNSLQEPISVTDYLNGSEFDQLLELDLARDRWQWVARMDDRTTRLDPLPEGTLEQLREYVRKHLARPADWQRIAPLLDPATLGEQLERADPPGMVCGLTPCLDAQRQTRWIQWVLLAGEDKTRARLYLYHLQRQETAAPGEEESAAGRVHLPGESEFIARAPALLARQDGDWCFLFLDIENFKLFNDWFGREQGDRLLREIGTTLGELAREQGGLAGYQGQDDFLLLLPDEPAVIRSVYDRVVELLGEYGSFVGFLPAVGVSTMERGAPIPEVLNQAALAADQVKGNFQHRIQRFDPLMRDRAEDEYRILFDFQRALGAGELSFYLQPQCRISTGKVVGAESLVRWKRADGTMVRPDQFIPVLEKYGFISQMDRYVWEQVCAWIHRWIEAGNTPVPVSINVSRVDLMSMDVPAYLTELVQKYHLPAGVVKTEITESAYVEDNAKVRDAAQRLREAGFPVLMDDFGSGYSSLNMLRRLNVDIIKLDAQFLSLNAEDNQKGAQIVETVINMTRTLGIPVIVEGVEKEEHVRFLENMGCRYIQGYYFYRPMPVQDFETLISEDRILDTAGFTFKANQQFTVREFMDENIYSDNMLNNILGAVAFYCWDGRENVDIIRFNEQFYKVVNVPDFHQRLKGIQQFFHPNDVPLLYDLLRQAREDRLNGSTGVVGVYRTDGSIGRFLMKFYYLEEGENGPIFYGNMQEITQVTELQNQMRLLSAYSSSSVVFLRRQQNAYRPQVVIHGLRRVLKMTEEDFRQELEDGAFYDRMEPGARQLIEELIARSVREGNSFGFDLAIENPAGEWVSLHVKSDPVRDEYSDAAYILHFRLKDD